MLKDTFKLKIVKEWRKFNEVIDRVRGEFSLLKKNNESIMDKPYLEFIDMQIYKILDCQLKTEMKLTDLTNEIGIRLIYTNKLEFSPSRLEIVNILYNKHSELLSNI